MPNIAIVDKTGRVGPADLQNVAAAINTQVQRDLPQAWPNTAGSSVMACLDATQFPDGYWPIFIMDSVSNGLDGIHLDSQGIPYAYVKYGSSWSLPASHEALEMLVDATLTCTMPGIGLTLDGNNQVIDSGEMVNYLLEVCDPCQDHQFSYLIGTVVVSDFYTPNYFDVGVTDGVAYSFSSNHGGRNITSPRTVLNNGYVTWREQSGEVRQLQNNDGTARIISFGNIDPSQLSRAFVDRTTKCPRALHNFPENSSHREYIERHADLENRRRRMKLLELIQRASVA